LRFNAVIAQLASRRLLIAALRNPACLAQIDIGRWELLVRQARRADLLPALALRLARAAAVTVPSQAQAHLDAATVLASAQRAEVLRELAHIRSALATVGVQPVLLKGAAYVAAGLPPSEGRLFNDIDLMLPKRLLPQAEAQLMLHGWATTHHSAYDQRYYREWMHELPPMRHIQRQSVLDLHHAILPETARLSHDPAKLLAAAVPAPLCPGFRVLGPVDMVLHSVSHLAHNDDTTHLLRDLTDIDLLLRNFCERANFWSELLSRAQELNLARPLHYILRESYDLLCTPVPPSVLRRVTRAGAPGPLLGYFMRGLWRRAMCSAHPSMATGTTPFALGLLYVRAHWLRMPPLLLARHLTVKAFKLHEKPAD
jgi:hypothetical protein